NEMIYVYLKKEGLENTYTRFEIGRQIDAAPLVYVDYFRLIKAMDYTYNSIAETMTPTGVGILATGENEFTMKIEGKIDHTGGVHGDEILQDFKFLADGKELDLSEAITLTPCTFFEYIEKSTLHETADSTAPTTPIEGNPVIADHYKHTIFRENGYKTKNKIKNISGGTLPNERLYVGILCVDKNIAATGNDEELTELTFTGSDTQLLKKYGVREIFSYN